MNRAHEDLVRTVDAQAQLLREQGQLLAKLSDDVAWLRGTAPPDSLAGKAPPVPVPVDPVVVDPVPAGDVAASEGVGPMDRRRALKYLGTAAATGSVLAVSTGVVDAGSAAAANPGFGGYNDVGPLQTNLVTNGLGPALLVTQDYATIADPAVKGRNSSASSTGAGLAGSTAGSGPGVDGFSAAGPGVRATSNSNNAVEGKIDQANGTNGSNGVYGTTSSTGNGVFGEVTNTSSTANALLGIHAGPGNSVFGYKAPSTPGDGVVGYARSGRGVFGISEGDAAILGQSGTGPGVRGYSGSSNAVEGRLDSASGANGYNAVYGTTSSTGNGVFGEVTNASSTASGVLGVNSGGGNSVFGLKPTGVGGDAVVGLGRTGRGVLGVSDSGIGVQAAGGLAPMLLVPSTTVGSPAAGAHSKGELYTDSAGSLWSCVTAGSPGVWREVAGSAAAGSFHILPAPIRVYDSRPGTFPGNGPKTPLAGNTARVLDVSVNNSGVPLGATAVSISLLLVNTATGNGNFTIWANGVTRPQANNMVWGGSDGRFSSLAISAVDASAKVQVLSSLQTDFVLDVAGYYR